MKSINDEISGWSSWGFGRFLSLHPQELLVLRDNQGLFAESVYTGMKALEARRREVGNRWLTHKSSSHIALALLRILTQCSFLSVEHVLLWRPTFFCRMPIINRILGWKIIVVYWWPTAGITRTLFPIIELAQMVTTVPTSPWNLFIWFRLIQIFDSSWKPSSLWIFWSRYLGFHWNLLTSISFHSHVYHHILIVYDWLYICLFCE